MATSTRRKPLDRPQILACQPPLFAATRRTPQLAGTPVLRTFDAVWCRLPNPPAKAHDRPRHRTPRALTKCAYWIKLAVYLEDLLPAGIGGKSTFFWSSCAAAARRGDPALRDLRILAVTAQRSPPPAKDGGPNRRCFCGPLPPYRPPARFCRSLTTGALFLAFAARRMKFAIFCIGALSRSTPMTV